MSPEPHPLAEFIDMELGMELGMEAGQPETGTTFIDGDAEPIDIGEE